MPIYFPPGATAVVRERITSNRTYYVATTGSDSNDGLTVGAAFLTLQKALDVVATIDFNGFTVTIQLSAGTYSGQSTVPVTVGQKLPSSLLILGNTGSPSSVTITHTAGFQPVLQAVAGARCAVRGVQITGTSNAFGLTAQAASVIETAQCLFGSGLWYGLYANGGLITVTFDYEVSGGGFAHWGAEGGGKIMMVGSGTLTLTGTPAYSNAFALVDGVAYIRCDGNTFSGAATGKRYNAVNGGAIQTQGAGATYLPGSVAGTSPTGYYA